MEPVTGAEALRGYEVALASLRRGLRPTLRAIEQLAADPGAHDELEEELPHLQYALHAAAERALELQPLPGREEAHEQLQVALVVAREETAQVTEAVEEGGPAAIDPLLWEWRGALFGVRLALQRLEATASAGEVDRPGRRPLLPVILLLAGVVTVLGGALVGVWPVWVVGLALVTASTALTGRA